MEYAPNHAGSLKYKEIIDHCKGSPFALGWFNTLLVLGNCEIVEGLGFKASTLC